MDEKLYYSNGPSEWQYKQLGDVVTFQGGSQPPKKYFSNEKLEGMIRLIQIRDYKSDLFKTYVPKELCRRFCNSDDIMIGRYGPPIFQILRGIEGAYNVALIKAIPNEELINKEYLYYFIKNEHLFKLIDGLSQRTSGQTGIDMEVLKKYIIPIPNKDEQEKIASILSTVDEQINNVDILIEKNKELKKGLMQTLLTKGIGHTKFKKTEIGEIPEEWTLVKIGDVAKFQAGYAFKSSDYVDNGVKLVKITNVQQKDLLWNDTDFLPEEFLNKYKEYSLEINDVIIAMTRPIISSGIKICKVKKEDTPALLNQRVGRFITSENVNNKYLYQYCFSNYFINKVNELCSTTGQPNISSNQLESIMISLPSTEEQEKIGSILLNVDEKMEEYENKKQKLEELKKGLMQQLLSGNIRVS